MAEPKISDEAVEAACVARYAGWGHYPDSTHDRLRASARRMLAAAYPLLRKQWESEQAEALREANADGYSDGFNDGYQAASEVHGA